MARKAGKVWREHGALDYKECIADDVKPGKWTSFPQSVKLKTDETVWFSYIVYKNRKQRDRVMAKVMKDKRLASMMDPKKMPFDGKRMIFGGFKVVGGPVKPFEISRVFDAPRDKVWKAWTETDRLKQWWGPAGFKVHTCKVDLRPGGSFLYGMTAPDGTDMWGRFVYREIKAPHRLVFITSFSDAKGGVTRHPWSPNWPLEIHSTVMFEEQAAARPRSRCSGCPPTARASSSARPSKRAATA